MARGCPSWGCPAPTSSPANTPSTRGWNGSACRTWRRRCRPSCTWLSSGRNARPPDPISSFDQTTKELSTLPGVVAADGGRSPMPKENSKDNDLEGAQDMGGKHGGQKGVPKPEPRPKPADSVKSEDVPERRPTGNTGRG